MRQCEWCNQSIIWKNAHARYCSTRCRVAAHRAGFPRTLTAEPRWVRWRIENRNGKPTKAPIQADGHYASSTDPSTWATLAAVRASKEGDGIGFVLGNGYAGIDLDHCLIDGQPTDAARAFLSSYPDHYIEISPSGDGLHILGTDEPGPGSKRTINGLSVERYSTGRYFTMTGRTYQHGTLLPL